MLVLTVYALAICRLKSGLREHLSDEMNSCKIGVHLFFLILITVAKIASFITFYLFHHYNENEDSATYSYKVNSYVMAVLLAYYVLFAAFGFFVMLTLYNNVSRPMIAVDLSLIHI